MSKNILLVSNAYFPSIGGIENSLRHLAKEAIDSGDDVKIIVSDIAVPLEKEDRFFSVIDGVTVIRFPVAPIKGIFRIFNVLVQHWCLYKILRDEYRQKQDSIVIARFHFGALMALWAGFEKVRYLVPSVVSCQTLNEFKKKDVSFFSLIKLKAFLKWHDCVQAAALKRSENYVFSESMEAQCLALAPSSRGSYQLVKPGVDPKRFFAVDKPHVIALRSRLGLPTEKKIILFVGRFVKAKGVDLLIESMKLVEGGAHLVIVGGGAERQSYIDEINSSGLQKKVTLIEKTKAVELYYRCADLFVMSSRYEPLGQTLLEAFCSGVPVVAFKKNQGFDTATEELGMDDWIVYAEEGTASGLALAINSAFCDKLILESKGSLIKEAERKFSWRRLYGQLTGNES